jgi:hypothetical protein
MLTVLGSARRGHTSIALPPCSATTMADPSPPLSPVAPDDTSSSTPSATALERRWALDVEMQHRAVGRGRPRAATAASLQHKCVPPPAPNHHLASKHADELVCCRPMVSLTAVSRGDYSSSKRTSAVSGSSCPSLPGHSDPWCFDVSGQSHASGSADDGYVVGVSVRHPAASGNTPVSSSRAIAISPDLTPAVMLQAPVVNRERATYLPGSGRPKGLALTSTSLASSASAPVLKHSTGGDTAWWASSASADGRNRRRATSLTSEAARATGSSRLKPLVDRPMSTSAASTVRWFSDPVPAVRRALNASRRSSDALPSPPLPVFRVSVPGSPTVPRIILPSGQTYEQEPRWSIFEKLQPKDSTLELILSEVGPTLFNLSWYGRPLIALHFTTRCRRSNQKPTPTPRLSVCLRRHRLGSPPGVTIGARSSGSSLCSDCSSSSLLSEAASPPSSIARRGRLMRQVPDECRRCPAMLLLSAFPPSFYPLSLLVAHRMASLTNPAAAGRRQDG